MSKDTQTQQQIEDKGAFPEQTKSQGTQAPQSVLDSISEQAVVEQTHEGKDKKKPPLLPRLNIDMFFNRSHLKRRVKVLIALYCVIVFGTIAYGLHTTWQKNAELTQTWEEREIRYIQKLAAVDLLELSELSSELDSGVQVERDPVTALFIMEQLAREVGVTLMNPSYTISSSAIKSDEGVALSLLVNGEGEHILRFLDAIQGIKPVLSVQSVTVQPINDGEYQASLLVEYLYTTHVDEGVDEVEEKFTTGILVEYPLAGIEGILKQLADLRVIVMDKIGTFVLGKEDLFSS